MADVPAIWESSAEPARHYDTVLISLHWLTLALVILLFASAWTLDQASDEYTADLILLIHRSAGIAVWIVTIFRLGWKSILGDSPQLPLSVPRPQQWLARATHHLLYLLLVVQPITGFVQSIARGKPFPLIGFWVPSVMARDKRLVHLFEPIHSASATALLAIVVLHACAALFHGFVLRDGVLGSMLPGRNGDVASKLQSVGNKSGPPGVYSNETTENGDDR